MGLFATRAYGARPSIPYPASAKQVAFLRSLVASTADAPFGAIDYAQREDGAIMAHSASAFIDHLLKLRELRTADGLAALSATPTEQAETMRPGMYGAAGRIFKVTKSQDSDRLYAKELVKIGGERLTETGETVKWEFQYAPGAIHALRPHHRLTLEEAQAFGIKTGVCCDCGRPLKDAKSVARGIGPTCLKKWSAAT